MITDILEAVLLVTALCIDAFVASFGYGVDRIKIPFISAQIINLVCGSILAAAVFLGIAARSVISGSVAAYICVAILLILGAFKLFDSIIKRRIRKGRIRKNISFKFLSLSFILHVYADPVEADMDCSRVLSPVEAAYLAVALSIDGMTVGFGAGLVTPHPVMVVVFSLVLGFAAVMLGGLLGRKTAEKLKFDLSWLGGAILIIIGCTKLL